MKILKAITNFITGVQQKEKQAEQELVDEMQTSYNVSYPFLTEDPKPANYAKIARALLALGSFRRYVKAGHTSNTLTNRSIYCDGYEAGRTEIFNDETISKALAAYLSVMSEARKEPNGARLGDEVRAIRFVVQTIAFNTEPYHG